MNEAVAQFEPRDGDKTYNLSAIDKLTQRAKSQGADAICFDEMSVKAYTFAKDLTFVEISEVSEEVPNGKSTRA